MKKTKKTKRYPPHIHWYSVFAEVCFFCGESAPRPKLN